MFSQPICNILDVYVMVGINPADITIDRKSLLSSLLSGLLVLGGEAEGAIVNVDLFGDGTAHEWQLTDVAREYITSEMQRRLS